MQNMLKQNKGFLDSPKVFIDQLRLIKSPAEIELMKKSCQYIVMIEHLYYFIKQYCKDL